tara:strand:- start:2540 stop:3436 length:897 start_codon:yes stop_codon:yes gene_type:complete
MDFLRTLGKGFHDVWNLQLYSSGSDAVRLNQLVIAFLVIAVGVALSKKVTRLLGGWLTRTGRIASNTAYILQRIVSYTLFVIVALIALPIAGIPITILGVLGGAFAIGIGFGAQNIFNNLISGVIIMLERPVRIGDIVQLNEEEGYIEDIGSRCVRMRRGDGIDVLIPNSYFIEQPVVNWTLRDRDVRGTVTVGVAYGSAAEVVRDLLVAAAAEDEAILKSPEPVVLFQDFGDSALIFTVYFWTHVRNPMDLKRVQSSLRYRIDAAFHENGIVIAFPQRDLHLNAAEPLAVELVRSDA